MTWQWFRCVAIIAIGTQIAVTATADQTRPGDVCHFVENFSIDSTWAYRACRDISVETESGFGKYSEDGKAQAVLTRTAESGGLEVRFEIPVLFDWGNWLSLRREFASAQNLDGCQGLELTLTVDVPSAATMRLTVCDAAIEGASPQDCSDEMWWFDLPSNLLQQPDTTVTIRAPFENFRLGWGAGVRINNRQKDFGRVVAYEFNLLIQGRNATSGQVTINALKSY